ncbi:MAG: transposase [candidate division WS1 bacterium]|jgi:putative transposase|nr:transposase [candidate division WS1 bacterium]
MPRDTRIVVPGVPHHVLQRAYQGRRLFHSPEEYQRYQGWLQRAGESAGVQVWAYCLMPKHVHLILVPEAREALGKVLRTVGQNLARQLNQEGRPGERRRLERARSCPLRGHLPEAVRYVERTPVRAGRVKRAEEYPWSSAAGHCGLREDPLLHPARPLRGQIADWGLWLWSGEDQALAEELRRCTEKGKEFGVW